MPIKLKTNVFRYKDPLTGNYHATNALLDSWESEAVDSMRECIKILFGFHPGEDYSISEAANIVKAGVAPAVFTPGDQFAPKWSNGQTEYVMNMDVVRVGTVLNQYGAERPGMELQSHYTVTNIQFDAAEAIWYCRVPLPAGTYYFTFGTNWGSNVHSGDVYHFTLTQAVPIGGQVVIAKADNIYDWSPHNTAPANWRVYTFSSATSVTPIETVTIATGASGENLGTLSGDTAPGNSGLNNLYRAGCGYTRWSQSGVRQWLNSDAGIGEWWTPQNVYDRPPVMYTSMPGFLSGLDPELRAVIAPTRHTTALNQVFDSSDGATEETTDIVYLQAVVNEYIQPRVDIPEGVAWDYWKERLGVSQPLPMGTGTDAQNANLARYNIANHTAKSHVLYRSAFMTDGFSIDVNYNLGSGASYVWGGKASDRLSVTPCVTIL